MAQWYCTSLEKASRALNFCHGAVDYDPSLTSPEGVAGQDIQTLVKMQDNAASKMFFYHIEGMGLEAWDHTEPQHSDDDCIKAVWRMACYTYFPRAPLGCHEGLQASYFRPCRSCCQNYIKACGVECCDESVQCVFEHTKAFTQVTTTGYLPHDGPSSLCTGAALRRSSPGLAVLLLLASRAPKALLFVALALVLQGCDYDVPSHSVGNWRAEPDYLIDFQFVPPGSSPREALLNTCEIEHLSPVLQCNGRGMCKFWGSGSLEGGVAFCECDRDWADPECKTRRKSQAAAFFLSLTLGFLGVDHFYLGFKLSGILKLLTLGGGGLWWVIDFIRIGSAPVATKRFRLAGDLPHWVFVFVVVTFALVLGFAIAHATAMSAHVAQRKDAMMHTEEEEAFKAAPPKRRVPPVQEGPVLHVSQVRFSPAPSPPPSSRSVMQDIYHPLPSYGAVAQDFVGVPRRVATPPSEPVVPARSVTFIPSSVASL